MKKLLFMGLFLMSASMFASGGKKDNSNGVIYDTTACCTQSANGGEPILQVMYQ